jgi:hypothetical protein
MQKAHKQQQECEGEALIGRHPATFPLRTRSYFRPAVSALILPDFQQYVATERNDGYDIYSNASMRLYTHNEISTTYIVTILRGNSHDSAWSLICISIISKYNFNEGRKNS